MAAFTLKNSRGQGRPHKTVNHDFKSIFKRKTGFPEMSSWNASHERRLYRDFQHLYRNWSLPVRQESREDIGQCLTRDFHCFNSILSSLLLPRTNLGTCLVEWEHKIRRSILKLMDCNPKLYKNLRQCEIIKMISLKSFQMSKKPIWNSVLWLS